MTKELRRAIKINHGAGLYSLCTPHIPELLKESEELSQIKSQCDGETANEIAGLVIEENKRLTLERDGYKEMADSQFNTAEKLRQERDELRSRFDALVKMIWDTRWADQADNTNDYQDMVGIAAEIRSGNFEGIDKAAIAARGQG